MNPEDIAMLAEWEDETIASLARENAALLARAEQAEARVDALTRALREIVAVRLDVRVGDAAQAKARYTMRGLARAALAAVSEEAA